MVGDASRFVAAAASIPLLLAAHAWRRAQNGPAAVVELHVTRVADVADRALLARRVARMAHDPTLSALLLRIEGPPGGWAATHDLREAIAKLRLAGRPVYAWVESPGNAAMWLASACDRVFLLRTGEVALVGLGAELTFLGGVLDRLGVEADIVAAGAYKSFGEQFTRTFASAENREATGLVLDDLQAALLDDVAAGRGISREAVRAAMDAAPLGPQDALAAGLVDALMYADELDAWVT
jgi:protease-4